MSKSIEAADIKALLGLGGDIQPTLHWREDHWTLTIAGSTGTFNVISQCGITRRFKKVETAIKLLRDAGFNGFVSVQVVP